MLSSMDQFQQIPSHMVFKTSDNQEIAISNLKLDYIINSFPHHLLPINCDEILACEDQIKELIAPSFITLLDSIQEEDMEVYQSICLNIQEDVSKTSYSNIKTITYPNVKNRAETSIYLLLDNDSKFQVNINKLTKAMFILFRQQLELSANEEISTYIQTTKKLYRTNEIFKASLDLNALKMVVYEDPTHLSNTCISLTDMDVHEQLSTSNSASDHDEQPSTSTSACYVSDEQPSTSTLHTSCKGPTQSSNTLVSSDMDVQEQLLPSSVTRNSGQELPSTSTGNSSQAQNDDIPFGLLIDDDDEMNVDIDNINIKQYSSIMKLSKYYTLKLDFIQTEKAKLKSDPAYREKAVNQILIYSTTTDLTKGISLENNAKQAMSVIDYEHEEVEVNYAYLSNVSEYLNKSRAHEFMADIFSACRLINIKLTPATRINIRKAVSVINVDTDKNGDVRSRVIKIPIIKQSTALRFHSLKCDDRAAGSFKSVIDGREVCEMERVKAATIQSNITVTLTHQPIENSTLIAVASALTDMQLNHVAIKLEKQLSDLGIHDASILSYNIWCPFMDKSTPPNTISNNVLTLMILVPQTTTKERINEIKDLLFMTDTRTSFITIGSTILHLKHSVADLFYTALPREVRQNSRCLVISNVKFLTAVQLTPALERIVPIDAIKDIYYFQRTNAAPVTYTVVLQPGTTEPITLLTELIDQHCYESHGRIYVKFSDVKPVSNYRTIQSRNIFAIDPINLSNPKDALNKKMPASIRGLGTSQRK